jgi:hypothetical protein
MWGKGERLNEERAQQAIDNGVTDMVGVRSIETLLYLQHMKELGEP